MGKLRPRESQSAQLAGGNSLVQMIPTAPPRDRDMGNQGPGLCIFLKISLFI